jgi:hypothetical protein
MQKMPWPERVRGRFRDFGIQQANGWRWLKQTILRAR